MPEDIELLKTYLRQLHLEERIADMYTALCSFGPQTISELSRNSGVERTRIYRMLPEIRRSKLINIEIHYKREILSAAPISNLQMLLGQRANEISALQAGLPQIYALAAKYEQQSLPTRVQYYKGLEGIKQMLWNETKAKTEGLSILCNNMQRKVGPAYFESWVRQCNTRGLRFRGIVSDQFIHDQQEWYAPHNNERLKHWEQRYIAPQAFPITHSTVIYNDVVSFYNWKHGNEVFGIEIYSAEIADAQRHFFELLWNTSTPSTEGLQRD